MIILDTDTLTHYSYGKTKVVARIEKAPETPVITVITQMEILGGRFQSILKAANTVELTTANNRFIKALELVQKFGLIAMDDEAANHFDRLRTHKKLSKMDRADMLIACIALRHRATLVTRNTKDYKDVPGLQLDNWVD